MLKVEASVEAKFKRSRLRGGEVLLTLVGTLGEVAIVPENLKGWNVARAVGVIPVRPDPGSLWVSICLRSEFIQHCIRTWATSTVQATFNLRDLVKLPIPMPPKEIRESIAHILGTLDDKIELNRRMNATLEAMARALFQSWFVDFDPVRRNAEGAIPRPEDSLFPNSFENSAMGEIPKGWGVKALSELCTLGRGASPRPINDYMDGEVPWIKIADATAAAGPFLFETKERVKKAGAAKSVPVVPGDLILSNSATCGVPIFVEFHGCIHDGWLYFKNLHSISKLYLFHVLIELAGHLINIADGSVQKNLNTALVGQQNVLVPPNEVLDSFERHASGWFAKIRANSLESRTLSALRDTLLPQLLDGSLTPVQNRFSQ